MTNWLLLIQLFATLAMVGVIWFVQVVHYPLFAKVQVNGFTEYERSHQNRTTVVVMPLMLAEAGTATLLALNPPAGTEPWLLWTSWSLVVVIWLSTFLWQVPKHEKLSAEFDPSVHRALVLSNWFRTVCWTVRGILVMAITVAVI